jgi:hypothetical protein
MNNIYMAWRTVKAYKMRPIMHGIAVWMKNATRRSPSKGYGMRIRRDSFSWSSGRKGAKALA